MEVKDKIMFHFNTRPSRSDFWTPGNVINIDDSYVSDFWKLQMTHDGMVPLSDGSSTAFYKVIRRYLEDEQDTETYIRMLEEARRMLNLYSVETRERAFEDCRKENFPHLPSRKNSVYLCDVSQLNHWCENLFGGDKPEDIELYEVSVTGELFESSDALLPDDGASYDDCYKAAMNYWSANLDGLDETKSEYLFRGTIKVLNRVDVKEREDDMTPSPQKVLKV